MRNVYESNTDMVKITLVNGQTVTARIHPSELHETQHKICYSSDDYLFVNDADIISVTPLSYNKAKHKDGVLYRNLGTSMQLIYTIETTMHDTDVKNDYSNMIQRQCKNITDTLELFNTWQAAGYKNISIQTIVNMDNDTLIEDSSETMLELSINNSEMQELKQENKRLQATLKQKEVYEAFINKYKVQDTFKKFKDDYHKSNKDANGLYWYEMRLRPVSIGCQPSDFVKVEHNKGNHGIVAYDRPLKENELIDYDMSLWNVS
ncbi:hypothetical protein D3C73_278160 [compost metagenome]